MKNIGIIAKISNPEAIKTAETVAAWLAERGITVYVETAIDNDVPSATAMAAEDIAAGVEAMVVLGGDGTMLHTVNLVNGKKLPLLGVNQGGLGFLTAITVEETFPILERMIKNDLTIEERMLFSVEVKRDGEVIGNYTVLNDVVIKSKTARLILLETSINKQHMTTYRADGLIVSTPTGSTAYSLSASGPILYPTIHSIIVSPVCPFNISKRPVVIPDWMEVDVTICLNQDDVLLMLDGQIDFDLQSSDVVAIKRSEKSAYLITSEEKSYFEILRERLMWEDNRYKEGSPPRPGPF